MDKRKKSLLIGLVLGDGHLNPHSGVHLEIDHGSCQKFYIEYKAKLLAELLNCKEPKLYYRKSRDTYKLSKGHRYFRILRNWIYKDKVKRFSKQLLSYLTPEAIAIWWMDDGSHSVERHKVTGKIRAHSFHWYTVTNAEDTQNIIDYFYNTYNIKFYPLKKKLKSGETAYYLKCRTKEGRKFCDLIRPYILPEFHYKIMKIGE